MRRKKEMETVRGNRIDTQQLDLLNKKLISNFEAAGRRASFAE